MKDDAAGPSIAIVDNDRFTRRAIRGVLEETGRYRVIWDRSSGLTGERLTLNAATRPDVLLLDMSLGEISGVDVCRAVRRKLADVRILGITAFPPEPYAGRLAAAGAQGLIGKESDAELLAGVRSVLAGHTYCPGVPAAGFMTACEAFQTIRNGQRDDDGIPALTNREITLLERYTQTGSYKIIARELGITESTARNTMAGIRRKLGTTSTAAAILAWRAMRQGDMS